jgi:hypothetical protein
MRGLAERELLPLWEAAMFADPLVRADALLTAALPDLGDEERGALTLGQRDAALLSMYALTFGPRLEGFVRCPECGEPLQIDVDDQQVRTIVAATPELGEHELAAAGWELRFRALTCGDLAEVVGEPDRRSARLRLVRRCMLGCNGDPTEIPEEVLAVLAAQLQACDPQAEIGLSVACPECEHAWRATIDMSAFLSASIEAVAVRLLEDVHVLASSYGWRESDVLALSRRRRELYLELTR